MSHSSRYYILVAQSFEAAPLIEHFCLERDTVNVRAEIFCNEHMFLAISGSGKIRAAASVGAFFGGQSYLDDFVAVNVGLALQGSGDFETGTPFLIHKIKDNASGREFFPDMCFRSSLKEASLVTLDRFDETEQDDILSRRGTLSDLEGAGFFEAASLFLPPHRIGCIKIAVANGVALHNKRDAMKHLHAVGPALESVLDSYRGVSDIAPPRLERTDVEWIRAVSEKLMLTVAQRVLLTEWAASRRARKKEAFLPVEAIEGGPPTGKHERNRRFEAIRKYLLS